MGKPWSVSMSTLLSLHLLTSLRHLSLGAAQEAPKQSIAIACLVLSSDGMSVEHRTQTILTLTGQLWGASRHLRNFHCGGMHYQSWYQL